MAQITAIIGPFYQTKSKTSYTTINYNRLQNDYKGVGI